MLGSISSVSLTFICIFLYQHYSTDSDGVIFSQTFTYARSTYTLLCRCAENNKDCKFDTQGISSVNTLTNQGMISIDEGISNEGYYFCGQSDITFPPHKAAVQGDNKWMMESQESSAGIYGWTCFVLLIVYCVFVLGKRVIRSVMSLVKKVYEECCISVFIIFIVFFS